MVRRGPTCTLMLMAAQVCLACSPSVDPIEVAAGCPTQPLRGPGIYVTEPTDRLIDDFESGDYHLNNPGPVREGAWVLGSDGSSGKRINEVSSQCVARGKFSGHFAARGFSSWGNNWTAVFRTPGSPALPYDGSKWNAISFWAAFGGDNGPEFGVPMGLTTMDNAWNSGGCTVCMDFYATEVPLTRHWQRFVIPFDQMAQKGTGIPQVPMRRDQLVGFIIYPRQQFDIWIDDLRFEP